MNLSSMVPYQTRIDGNSVYVLIGQGPGDGAAPAFAAQPSQGAAPRPAAAATGERSIRNIDFRRGADGAGQIVVELNDPRTTVDVREEGGRIVVDFQDTTLPQELLRRLDVTDFATPVFTVDALRANQDARLVVTAAADYDQVAYQSDNQFTLELKPPVQQAAVTPGLFDEDREYTGERLTLNFQDLETRAVLQLIADFSGLNIVVSDTVQGSVTLRLQNVPWDQALDIVMTTKGLDMRRNGNVIIVAPAEEISAREQAELEALQALQTLEPLRSEFIQVNYAKAAELANLIRGEGQNSLLSERGTVAIDERTNTLLVNDTGSTLANVRRLVTTLDIPVRQVLIESRVVIVNDDYSRELGVRFGATAANDNSGNGLIGVTGTGLGTAAMVGTADDRRSGRLGTARAGPAARLALQREPAGRQPGRLDRARDSRQRLPRRPRALGVAGRRRWPRHLDAAHRSDEPTRSADPARYRDPVPGVLVERRNDDVVQGSRVEPHGRAADHARRPHHHGPHGHEGLGRRDRIER